MAQREQQLAEKNQLLAAENLELSEQLAAAKEQAVQEQAVQEQAVQDRQMLDLQRREIQQLRDQPITLPPEMVVPGHQFGPKLICLCMKLVQKIGFRPSESALQIVFDFLGIEAKVRSPDSMRTWACRIGVAIISAEEERIDKKGFKRQAKKGFRCYLPVLLTLFFAANCLSF